MATDRTAHEQRVLEAARQFSPGANGGAWGRYLAWIVGGAPTREEGIAAARQINLWRVDLDTAVADWQQAAQAQPHPLACQNPQCGHARVAHGKYDRCSECLCRHFEQAPPEAGRPTTEE